MVNKRAVSVFLEEDVYRQTKAAAGLSGRKMSEWIEEALRAALKKPLAQGAGHRAAAGKNHGR